MIASKHTSSNWSEPLDAAGETEAADHFRRLAFEPAANFATGSEWLLEVALVSDIVLNRFAPAAPRDAAVREAKRLAQHALYGP